MPLVIDRTADTTEEQVKKAVENNPVIKNLLTRTPSQIETYVRTQMQGTATDREDLIVDLTTAVTILLHEAKRIRKKLSNE